MHSPGNQIGMRHPVVVTAAAAAAVAVPAAAAAPAVTGRLEGVVTAAAAVTVPDHAIAFPPSQGSAFDVGGWDVYGNDWRHFFDCMLAPVAKQAAAALDKLDLEVVAAPPKGRAPRKVSSTPLKE